MTERGKMENQKWHRLDNSAKIYPMLLNKKHQNLFRITAEMKEAVDPAILSSALANIMPRFPSFNVGLKRGFFWHYLEQLNGKPSVYEDSDLLIKNISSINTCGYNFRVSYYDKRIAVDFFHALCDGSGGMEFVKTLIYEYITILNHTIDTEEKIILPNSAVLKEEIDDSFLRYAQKVKLSEIKGVKELRGENAFMIDGFLFEYSGCGIIQGEIDTEALLKLARSNNATITAYLGAVLIYSIYKTKHVQPKGNCPIVLFIPINLRKIFPSKTLLNFSLFSRCKIDINGELTFEEILNRTKEALIRDTDKTILQDKINTTVKTEKLFIFRILPLPIKYAIFKFSQLFFGKNKKTLTFSNMGVVNLPKDMKKYVEKFTVAATTSKTAPYAVTLCSSFDCTTVSFTRKIIDTEIEKFFFRFLAEQQLEITVSSNYWEV